MAWDGDDLAGQRKRSLKRQQAAADARAHRALRPSRNERAAQDLRRYDSLARGIMGQLSRATNPAHRSMLESALKSINDEMGEG